MRVTTTPPSMMPRSFSSLVAASVLIGALASYSTASAADCSVTSVGFTPIDDLGPGTYQGAQGGLYPGGANDRPGAHEAAGLALAQSIEPIDGRIVLVSIGMSNTNAEFSRFIEVAGATPNVNPDVLIINAAQGGQDITAAANPNSSYWTEFVPQALAQRGVTMDDVQVVWVKQAKAGPSGTFLEHAELMRDLLGDVARILADKFPNVKLAYYSSRIYAGYASTGLNPEPYAYELGFSVRWMVEQQIGGDSGLNFDPDNGPVVAPWLSWGPYLWADGLIGRSDGLVWECSDFANDGTHPSSSGRDKVATLLLDHFMGDSTTVPWFVLGPSGVADPADADPADTAPAVARVGALTPNPFHLSQQISLELSRGAAVRVTIYDAAGRSVRRLIDRSLAAGTHAVEWDGRSSTGRRLPAGTYYVRVEADGRTTARRATLVR